MLVATLTLVSHSRESGRVVPSRLLRGIADGRRLTSHSVSTTTQLFNKVSNFLSDNIGSSIMGNGDTVTLAAGDYKCSSYYDGTCSDEGIMIHPQNLYGKIQCADDYSTCKLNAESTEGSRRRVMFVSGTGAGTLTIRAITFYKGDADGHGGGGLEVKPGTVIIELCTFQSCAAGYGGALYVGHDGIGGNVSVYATLFLENSSSDEFSNDARAAPGASMSIKSTCPSPYCPTCPSPYGGKMPTRGKRILRLAMARFCKEGLN